MLLMARKPFLSHEKTRHGRMVWYFKRNGKRIRMPDPYGSEEFKRAYEDALRGSEEASLPKTAKGTLRWLVAQYKRSTNFASLAPETRRIRDSLLTRLVEKSGDVDYTTITKGTIKRAMDKYSGKPNIANEFLKTMRHFLQWAVSAEHLEVNPALTVERVKAKIGGYHTWTPEEVEQYRQHHKVGTRARLAMDLLLFTGLRRSDAIKVGRQHVQDGIITIRTGKTKTWVHLPIFKQLQDSIDATPTADLAFIATAKGMPFKTPGSFGKWFVVQALAAGLPAGRSAHGLRKAGATIAANEGATAHELMAMYGWSRLAMAEVYTKEADKKRLARGASEKLANRM